MCCLCPSCAEVCSGVSSSSQFVPVVGFRVVHLTDVGPLDAWEINDAAQGPIGVYLQATIHISKPLLPLNLYCNDAVIFRNCSHL